MNLANFLNFLTQNWMLLLYLAGSVLSVILTFWADRQYRKKHPEVKDYEDAPAALSIAALFSWIWIFAIVIGKIMSRNDAPKEN